MIGGILGFIQYERYFIKFTLRDALGELWTFYRNSSMRNDKYLSYSRIPSHPPSLRRGMEGCDGRETKTEGRILF